ncbi:MAG: hypothetical protein FWE27_04815 [Defluviitaleaceae bacterium]|nr:hypothetical protein [Defluviitaleaceae bacterium]
MKKIKISLLILVMAMLFASCTPETGETQTGGNATNVETQGTNNETPSVDGEQRSAYEIYLLASEKLDNVDSMIMDSRTVMNMNMDGETTEMIMDAVIEMVVHSETDIDMRMVSTTKADGMEMPSEVYFRNGIMYMDMMGMQMKMPMPLEDMLEQLQGSGALVFPEEAVLSASMNEVADSTEITFTLSGSVMSDMIDSLTGGMLASMGLDSMSMSVDMGDIEYFAVIDASDMLTAMNMKMSMSMEADGEVIDMDIDMAMDVIRIGGVTINFPDNLDDFMDMSGMMF